MFIKYCILFCYLLLDDDLPAAELLRIPDEIVLLTPPNPLPLENPGFAEKVETLNGLLNTDPD